MESDPIGLLGGLNSYGYVNSLPLTQADPTGELLQAAPAVAVVHPAVAVALGYVAFKAMERSAEYVSEQPESSTGGGPPGCPPDDRCRIFLEALQRFHEREMKNEVPTPEANLSERIERLRVRREFNRLADDYNEQCSRLTGMFNKRFIVTFRDPTIPGSGLLEDVYTK
jgi:hypothetical protein